MAKLFLDMHKFRRVKSDKDSSTFEHADGHTITVNHKKLTPAQRLEMSSLPIQHNKPRTGDKEMMATGGGVAATPAKAVPTRETTGGQPVSDEDVKELLAMGQDNPNMDKKADGGVVKNYADGSDNGPVSPDDSAPVTVNVGTPASTSDDTSTSTDPNMPPPPAPVQQAAEQVQQQAAASQLQSQAVAATAAANNPTASLPPQAAGAIKQAATPDQPNDPFGNEAYGNNLEQGINEQKAGMGMQAKAVQQQASDEQKVLKNSIQNQQALSTDYQSNLSALMKEHQNFVDDVQKQHINPNQYMNDMSTGKRISTAIGLIAGGIGGGLTHQENPALKFINAQIDRDIDAQKANLGKSKNLLEANMQQFGNIRDATAMTQAMQQGVVSTQMKMAAARAAGPAAKAALLQGAGALDTQYAQQLGTVAMRRTLTAGANAGHVDPSQFIRMVVPENEKQGMLEELGQAQGMVKARDNINSAFDQLSSINTVGNRVMHLGFTPAAVAAIRDPLIAGLSKDTAGRFTDSDSKMLGSLFPAPGDSAQTIQVKRAQLNKIISEKMNFPKLKQYNLDPNSVARYDAQGKSKFTKLPPKIGN